ncbi:N-acetylmuramoyl-L-alanine amidase CwlH precursor [Jannaschia seosinensis]|uniref:N-acetylmuramoyl-L-alanine amidase n=1 Tax=Jannaschia seosinensis TaxID=313367 RepID=A0A0M7BBW9_9RHOB|nr:N-acetylmuramoyl-L-alanine amidase [Jannaschia seosinensis]CUH38734.1 N-acetylmuramoyl-L-alanine amidase CwlH precursor [Jannaschia seosinensis]
MDRLTLGQSLNLSTDMIAAGRHNRSGRSMSPSHITIHNTSNTSAGADALAHARFVTQTGFYKINDRKHPVSWHYTVDDMRVVKHLPVNEVGFHAKSGNRRSIGIEICMHAGIDQNAANDRAARLVAALMHDLGILGAQVVTHKHWTNKPCPKLLLTEFDAFVAAAQGHFDAILHDPTESFDPPDVLLTAEELTAIRNFVDGGTEAIDDDTLEVEDPHPGTLDPETLQGPGV